MSFESLQKFYCNFITFSIKAAFWVFMGGTLYRFGCYDVYRNIFKAFLVLRMARATMAESNSADFTGESKTQAYIRPIDELRGPIGMVIMAEGRSGSTMLGELFKQNEVEAW